jgi:hypothetical protein
MLKKVLGILTIFAALAWLAFFFNGVDQNQINIIFLLPAIINIVLVVKTKFWTENAAEFEGLKIIQFLLIAISVLILFTVFNELKNEIDLDDPDDIWILIIILFSIFIPFLYLFRVKK